SPMTTPLGRDSAGHGAAPPGRLPASLDEVRPERHEHDADHDGDDEPEPAADQQPRDQDRGDADDAGHDEAHRVASGMDGTAGRATEEPAHDQADDVKDHATVPSRPRGAKRAAAADRAARFAGSSRRALNGSLATGSSNA